jgi:hypothetical protein
LASPSPPFSGCAKPQIITLSDGTKLTFLGVTYGKHHVAPKIKLAGKLTPRRRRAD